MGDRHYNYRGRDKHASTSYMSKSKRKREAFNYRKAYFEKNPGLFGCIWFCSQCGIPMFGKYKCDAYIIDHSFALTGGYDGDNGKRNIDNLAKDARNFRKNYPVYLMVLSHPSSYAKEYLSKDKKVNYSATKGSQNLSTDADDVFVLRDNEVLQKEGLLAIENTKRRDASVIHDNIIMRKMFDVSHLEYDEKYQAILLLF